MKPPKCPWCNKRFTKENWDSDTSDGYFIIHECEYCNEFVRSESKIEWKTRKPTKKELEKYT